MAKITDNQSIFDALNRKIDLLQEIEEIRKRIREIVPILDETRKKASNFSKIEDIENRLQAIEIETARQISTEVNEVGKPKYSNETKRKAELKTRLQMNPERAKLLNELKELKQEKLETELEYKNIRDEFRALQIEAQLYIAEINLI